MLAMCCLVSAGPREPLCWWLNNAIRNRTGIWERSMDSRIIRKAFTTTLVLELEYPEPSTLREMSTKS
jgi:hypothetical protein